MMYTSHCQFFSNSLGCVFAKCYLNWFTVGKVIAKVKRVNFFETQCITISLPPTITFYKLLFMPYKIHYYWTALYNAYSLNLISKLQAFYTLTFASDPTRSPPLHKDSYCSLIRHNKRYKRPMPKETSLLCWVNSKENTINRTCLACNCGGLNRRRTTVAINTLPLYSGVVRHRRLHNPRPRSPFITSCNNLAAIDHQCARRLLLPLRRLTSIM